MVIITECGKIIYDDQIKYLYPETNQVQIIAPINTKSLYKIKRQGDNLKEVLDDSDLFVKQYEFTLSSYRYSEIIRCWKKWVKGSDLYINTLEEYINYMLKSGYEIITHEQYMPLAQKVRR